MILHEEKHFELQSRDVNDEEENWEYENAGTESSLLRELLASINSDEIDTVNRYYRIIAYEESK